MSILPHNDVTIILYIHLHTTLHHTLHPSILYSHTTPHTNTPLTPSHPTHTFPSSLNNLHASHPHPFTTPHSHPPQPHLLTYIPLFPYCLPSMMSTRVQWTTLGCRTRSSPDLTSYLLSWMRYVCHVTYSCVLIGQHSYSCYRWSLLMIRGFQNMF